MANGKFTVELTNMGKWLDGLQLFKPGNAQVQTAKMVWDAASKKFASGASGTVSSFVKGTSPVTNAARTWYRIERPLLQSNPNVTGINYPKY